MSSNKDIVRKGTSSKRSVQLGAACAHWRDRAKRAAVRTLEAQVATLLCLSPCSSPKSLPTAMTQRGLSEGPAPVLLKLENTLRPPVSAPPIQG